MMTLWQLTEWIEQHLHQRLPLTLLAEHVECSTRQLSTRFRQAFGDSPTAYIQKRRLTLASTLLRITRRNVTEIALMYQFNHLSSFTRAFKNHFGQSPQAYRLANYWDMSLFYPSVALADFTCPTDIVFIPENTCIIPNNNKKKEIHFGMDFIISTENGKIVSEKQIHQCLINIIFREGVVFPLVVCGTSLPGKDCDTDINICMGSISPYSSNKKGVHIPSGNYARFTFKSSPLSIMQFHAWAQGHGMHRHGLVMKKGPTISVFDRTVTEGIYKTEFYIPCLC
ncbi:AraC family transcriptional regulator [Salmonella enterica]|nr:AraC family transcriptional regulator [Salmonella enterica]